MYIVSTNQVVCMITHIRSELININYEVHVLMTLWDPWAVYFSNFSFKFLKKLYMRRRYQETCYRPVQVLEPGAMKKILLVITS
jgi:hypothetical protein